MRLTRAVRRVPAVAAAAATATALTLASLVVASPAHAAGESPDALADDPAEAVEVVEDVTEEVTQQVTQQRAGGPGAASRLAHLPVRPIDELDIERYQGRWLQLAAIPEDFAAACARDTQANYTLLPDGLVQVVNSCVTASGAPVVIEGRAQVVGPDSNAQLEVTFARDADGEFVFDGAGDYWVIGIDERDYGWAVVGNGERSSGFVLSREPLLTVREVGSVVVTLLFNGYDPCDFDITATTGGIEENVNLCHR